MQELQANYQELFTSSITLGLLVRSLIGIMYKIGLVRWIEIYSPSKVLGLTMPRNFCVLCWSFWFSVIGTIIYINFSNTPINNSTVLMPFIALGITIKI